MPPNDKVDISLSFLNYCIEIVIHSHLNKGIGMLQFFVVFPEFPFLYHQINGKVYIQEELRSPKRGQQLFFLCSHCVLHQHCTFSLTDCKIYMFRRECSQSYDLNLLRLQDPERYPALTSCLFKISIDHCSSFWLKSSVVFVLIRD